MKPKNTSHDHVSVKETQHPRLLTSSAIHDTRHSMRYRSYPSESMKPNFGSIFLKEIEEELVLEKRRRLHLMD